MKTKNHLRQDIQALRGIAVLLVIFYHLEIPTLQNGFYGVDIFFVISGYVITQNLNKTDNQNFEGIKNFYVGRARRIIPSSIAVIFLTTVITILIYPKVMQEKILKEAACSVLMISNACFHLQGYDYLNLSSNKSPFLQFWSLAIEEQFYLIWPVIFLLLGRFKNYKILFLVFPLFLLANITTLKHPGFSFYSPSSRAWEFLLGGLISLIPKIKLNRSAITFFQLSSRTILTISTLFYSSYKQAPSINTLLFVIPTAILIYVGFRVDSILKIIALIGNYSYSLYLVHWPVIVIGTEIFNSDSFLLKIGCMVVIFLISYIISNTIEKPFRYRNLKSNFKKLYQFPLISFFSIFLFFISSGITPSASKAISISTESPTVYFNGCHVQNEIISTECSFGAMQGAKLAMLVGDSHATHFFDGLNKASSEANVKLVVATRSGCPAAVVSTNLKSRENNSCQMWQENLINFISEKSPDFLFISNLSESSFYNTKFGLNDDGIIISYQNFFSKLKLKNTKIFYLVDLPYPKFDSAVCLHINNTKSYRCDIDNKFTTLTKHITFDLSKNFDITMVDLRDTFCDQYRCKSVVNGKNVFRDGSHISVSFSHVLWPYFLKFLINI